LLAFGGFALMLAAMGLYSAVAYDVSRQVKAFGIRLALGATRMNIVRTALRSTMMAIAAGTVMGYAVSGAANRLMVQWSLGTVSDPLVLGIVTVVLLTVTGAAALIPANRAASIHPARALRIDQ
jgi:ABC-type antimicrobial peptide transport system permease subunit